MSANTAAGRLLIDLEAMRSERDALEDTVRALEDSLAAAEARATMWRDKWRELVGIRVDES